MARGKKPSAVTLLLQLQFHFDEGRQRLDLLLVEDALERGHSLRHPAIGDDVHQFLPGELGHTQIRSVATLTRSAPAVVLVAEHAVLEELPSATARNLDNRPVFFFGESHRIREKAPQRERHKRDGFRTAGPAFSCFGIAHADPSMDSGGSRTGATERQPVSPALPVTGARIRTTCCWEPGFSTRVWH